MRNNKASATLVIVLVLAVAGGLAYLFPKTFDKGSRNADHSQQATASVDATQKAKESSVAASVTVIGQAAGSAPKSLESDFIIREVPLVLSQLAPPDPKKLIEAAERRAAIAEGNAALANQLYASAAKSNQELLKQVEEAKEYRRKVDLQLSEDAAYQLGAERTKMALFVIIGVLVVAAGYLKLHGISKETMGGIVAGIKAGENPISVIDEHLPKWMHQTIKLRAQALTPLEDKSAKIP